MTGVPQELVLMGDNFESDPIIYLTLATILCDKIDPWSLWNTVRGLESFKLTSKQNGQFLNKIYQLDSMINQLELKAKVKIFIRKKGRETEINLPTYFEKQKNLIELYSGLN